MRNFYFSANSRLWNPSFLRNSIGLWVDISDEKQVTLNGTTVSRINDKSSNNRTPTQASAGLQPLLVAGGLNGKSTIKNVSSDNITAAGNDLFRNSMQGTAFLVIKYVSSSDSGSTATPFTVASGVSSASTRMGFTAQPANNTNRLSLVGRRLDSDSYTTVSSSTTRASVSDKFIIEVGQFKWSEGKASHWTNGTQDLTDSAFLTAGNTSNTASSGFGIFATNSSGVEAMPDGGEIAEIICIDGILSETNRQKIEGYLAWKWGLFESLPNDHPYRFKGPRQ